MHCTHKADVVHILFHLVQSNSHKQICSGGSWEQCGQWLYRYRPSDKVQCNSTWPIAGPSKMRQICQRRPAVFRNQRHSSVNFKCVWTRIQSNIPFILIRGRRLLRFYFGFDDLLFFKYCVLPPWVTVCPILTSVLNWRKLTKDTYSKRKIK